MHILKTAAMTLLLAALLACGAETVPEATPAATEVQDKKVRSTVYLGTATGESGEEVRIPRVYYHRGRLDVQGLERFWRLDKADAEGQDIWAVDHPWIVWEVMNKYMDLFERQPNFDSVVPTFLVDENGDYTTTKGIKVYMLKKTPDEELPESDRVPAELEGVPVQFVVWYRLKSPIHLPTPTK